MSILHKDFFNFVKKYGWLCVVVVGLVISVGLYLAGLMNVSEYVLIGLCLVGVIPEIVSIVRDIFAHKFGVDIIAVVAILASLALHEYAAAGMILLMFTSGTALEEYAKARAQKELSSLLKRAPKIAHVMRGKVFIDIAVARVEPKDTLLIKPGETVPVDGVIVLGDSSFDESAITGESLPLDKQKNDSVLSGTINQDSPVQIVATSTSRASQYEQIITLVRSAASSKSPIVRLADVYSIPFTLIAFSLAAVAWALSGDPVRALAVLVVATPCPLLIATPVAIVSGMSRAAHDGIIVKDGGSLEKLAIIKAMAFDKTGTLTQNKPTIDRIVANGISDHKLLEIAASIEQESNHVLAGVVVQAAKKARIKLLTPTDVFEEAGGGIKAMIGTKLVVIGKPNYLLANKVELPESIHTSQATVIYIAQEGKYIGSIEFADPLRKNAKATL
ncbi:HAD-IC family P-type ATPase, partial [Candidatus Saccharibacteria bacterium]|nr:HAD-IC family P-type ATPase [Candidatus Saccharibacteria bacterium]